MNNNEHIQLRYSLQIQAQAIANDTSHGINCKSQNKSKKKVPLVAVPSEKVGQNALDLL